MVNLDKKTKELFDEIVANAHTFQRENPQLFLDIENVRSYSTYGSRIYDIALSSRFDDLFGRLLKTDMPYLIRMRDAAWKLRKKHQTETYNRENGAPYDFIRAVIRYRYYS